MSRYTSSGHAPHGEPARVGVLLANLGTPDAPTPRALRRYLREFLSDPRVVELPRPLWWFILSAFVLPFRPRRSARLYRAVWRPDGSPLLTISRRQAAGVATRLGAEIGTPASVELGMRYGSPSIPAALRALRDAGCLRIVVLPLYPQYAAATSGSTFDAVAAEFSRWRWVPELRTVLAYYDDPGYVAALCASIREAWSRGGQPERLLFSFHGIPRRYFDAGDPYFCHCQETARLVVEGLGFPAERASVAFQSRFGREEWLRPYTDETLRGWGRAGLASVDVVCPGFAADCLETLEEIAVENRDVFVSAGGGRFRYIEALNDRSDHLDAIAGLLRRQLAGWATPRQAWDEDAASAAARASARRAAEAGSAG